MCGIAGIFNRDGRSADLSVLEAMVRMVDYRGPDETGTFARGPVGLAHNRLSIIDLAGGHQPMDCDGGSLWITFNGEIFNYVELREELLRKGHRFLTRSDTEVILRLYREYGLDCVQHMNGQWAFAIWDAEKRKLFLSRDRLGIRPLFYAMAGQSFVFGSEIKVLFAHPGMSRELDLEALRQTFTYWFPLPPRTPFRGIAELPPGHSLVVDKDSQSLQRYWQIDFSRAEAAEAGDTAGDEKAAERLRELLYDSTRIRLRADVPVGAYLSGGLDSSIVAALAQQCVGSSLHTFSLAFEDPALDESRFQQEVVQLLGTEHQTIRCTSHDIGEAFPEVVWHAERPVLRTAPTPMYFLSGLVRENGFKVVLTGEGSDEFLGGYDIYKEAKIRAFWAAQIDSKARPMLLKRLYPYLEGIQKQSPAYLQAFFRVQPGAAQDPFFSHVPRWSVTSRSHAFFTPELRSEFHSQDGYKDLAELLPAGFSSWGPFSRAQYLESAFLLPAYLLSSQGDRMAMAHSVEGRYPFLDYRVVEFAAALSPRMKMRALNEKFLLKHAFGRMIPASVRRRPKQPYRAPDAVSFFDSATGEARHPYITDLLSSGSLRAGGIFDPAAVDKLISRIKTGKATGFLENAALVGILSTQLLIDQFIANFKERNSHATDRTRSAAVCN